METNFEVNITLEEIEQIKAVIKEGFLQVAVSGK